MRESWLRVRAMLRKELRQLLRDPRTKRVVFGAPLIQLIVFGYAVNTDVRSAATFVVDRDGGRESRRLVDALTASGYFRVVGRSDRSADLVRALDGGAAVVGLEIPSDFARNLGAGRPAPIQLLIDGTNSNTATVVQGYAARILTDFAVEYARGRGLPAAPAAELRARAWYNPNLASRDYNVPAVIGVLLMLMCLILTALSVVRERELGTLEQLMVTPISPRELILGKTLPVSIIALVDLALVTAVAIFWFRIPLRGPIPDLLLASLLYVVTGLALGLLVSTVSRTQQEAFLGMFLLFLPAIILSGFLYPIHTMPILFQGITYLNPIRYFLEVVRGIFLKGEGLGELWPQYVVLAAMAVGTLALAVRRFRKVIG